MRTFIAIAVCLCTGFAAPAQAEDPWADTVVSYSQTNGVSGFTTASAALGEPVGLSPDVPVNTLNSVAQVVSLGTPGGHLTVSFETPVTDDADNPFGLDFIIYSNAFWVGNDPDRRFQEPAIVEVSPDGANWYLIPGCRDYDYTSGILPVVNEASGGDNSGDPDILAGTILNPNTTDGDANNNTVEYNWGYAELSPTLPQYLDNFVRPDDPFETGMTARSGGGDAFDIAWAIDQSGALANLSSITHVRISPFINRTLTVGLATPEIMAVVDVAPDIDTDNDGILDDYETRVLETDLERPENTLLPLEIPTLEGGSPAATLLGTASRIDGHAITLFSTGTRTSDTLSTIIDLIPTIPTDGTISGSATTLTGIALQVDSTVTDFIAEQVDNAEVTIQYLPTHIANLDESALDVYRYDSGTWIQTGISNLQRIPAENTITFETRYSGTFALASVSGSGKTPTADIWVDFTHTGIQTGAEITPYAALEDGSLAVSDGGTVHIAPGQSNEAFSILTAMTLESTGGTVLLGVALSPEAPPQFQSAPTPSGFRTRTNIPQLRENGDD